MNILLLALQVLLALHTLMGAVWKLSNSAQAVRSLSAIPHGAWMAMSIVELVCALGLVLPAFTKVPARWTPIAAVVIAAEMLLFCGLHLASGDPNHGHLVYWLVVAGVCGFIVYGRLVLRPILSHV